MFFQTSKYKAINGKIKHIVQENQVEITFQSIDKKLDDIKKQEEKYKTWKSDSI